MTIEAKLGALVAADTTLAAALGTRVYSEVAEQRAQKPHLVIRMLAERPYRLQEANPQTLRDWAFQLTVVSETYAEARALVDRLIAVLVPVDERPNPGIQSIANADQRVMWIEADRAYEGSADFDIREDLGA